MFNRVKIDSLQKVTSQNFMDFGNFPLKTFDTILRDLFSGKDYYAGFTCTDAGAGQVRISAGRAYFGGKGYYNDTDGGELLDLLGNAPVVNTKYVAIVVQGQDLTTDQKPTTFLTNTTTRQTTSKVAPQELRRWAQVSAIFGQTAAAPTKPTVPSNAIVVAYVLMNSAGIQSIERNTLALAPSIAGAANRLDENDKWRDTVGAQIAALGSNMAAISKRLSGFASQTLVMRMAKDMARIRDMLNLPDSFSFYDTDTFADKSDSDTSHPQYLCNVDEGIRFPPAIIAEKQLQLLNPIEAQVTNNSGLLLPTYREVRRMYNYSRDKSDNVGQYTYNTYSLRTKNLVRERVRTGSYFSVSSKSTFFDDVKNFNAATGMLTLPDGKTYEVYTEDQWLLAGFTNGEFQLRSPVRVRVRRVWTDGYEDIAYSETITDTTSITGAIAGQTFVCPQDGWITRIQLYPSKIGPAGDLNMLLMEVPTSGQPDLSHVIGRANVPYAKMKELQLAYPDFAFRDEGFSFDFIFPVPIAGIKGRRYAWTVVTSGQHELWMTKDQEGSTGSAFHITDGAWAMGDPVYDYCFGLFMAKFNYNRMAFELEAMQLAGGIANIDILCERYVPAGCSVTFEGMFNGRWVNLSSMLGADTPLNGLPPLVRLRVLMSGNHDNHGAFGIGSRSLLRTFRPRTDMCHVSLPRTMPVGAPVKTVKVEATLESWDSSRNTHAMTLLYGGSYATTLQPDGFQDQKVPGTTDVIRTYVFTFPTTQAQYKIKQNGTTLSALETYIVTQRDDLGLVA